MGRILRCLKKNMNELQLISFIPTIFSLQHFFKQHFHDLKDHIEDSTELPQKATNTFSTATWILKKQKKIDPNQASRYCLRNT